MGWSHFCSDGIWPILVLDWSEVLGWQFQDDFGVSLSLRPLNVDLKISHPQT